MRNWTVKVTVPDHTMPRTMLVREDNASQAAKTAARDAGVDLSMVYSVVAS
jgi:hypothetical protein